jgi:hypothetical protein
MRRLLLSLGFLLACAGIASAQAPPVAQTATRSDAATGVCATAPAVNATVATGTCTITPPAGQFAYFTFLQVAACSDGTASTSSVQQAFTTTNLGGWTAQTSVIGYAATTAQANPSVACDRVGGARTTPLKSAASGGVVTIVPPAQAAHMSFPIIAEYYFAP